jgi:hypothetical protein
MQATQNIVLSIYLLQCSSKGGRSGLSVTDHPFKYHSELISESSLIIFEKTNKHICLAHSESKSSTAQRVARVLTAG